MISRIEATLAGVRGVITPSQYTRNGLVEHYQLPEDRVFAIPHGVDASMFCPGSPGGRDLVESKLGQQRPFVLFASLPSIAQKNLATLRDAVTRLVARGFPHALVIAGGLAGGESASAVSAIGADLPGAPGRVLWLGAVDDRKLAALMAAADAFCLPSHFESFGLTALEAMACGAPVVASNRGALPEVVGNAGILCDPTAESLEAALVRVLTDADLADRLRSAARGRALRMSWGRTADGWAMALRRTIALA